METYDVLVLGAGSAGEWVATTTARGGRKVAVVEERLVGGECPYFACMPSKAMLHAAEVRRLVGRAHQLGAVGRPVELEAGPEAYAAAVRWRDRVASHRNDGGHTRDLERSGAMLYRGRGRVVGSGRLVGSWATETWSSPPAPPSSGRPSAGWRTYPPGRARTL